MPFVTLVSLVLLGGVVGLLCFNTQMQQASFAATSLEAQSDNLAAREQTLHDELQEPARPPAPRRPAPQGAGMVVPQSSCTVRLAARTTDARTASRPPTPTPPRCCRARTEEAGGARPRPDRRHRPAAGRHRHRHRRSGGHHGHRGHHGGRGRQQDRRHGARLTRSEPRTEQDSPTRHSSHITHTTTHRADERARVPQPHPPRPPGPPRPS